MTEPTPSPPTSFCPWYPLAQVADHAPACPGVFQVRLRRGLLSYPRGKSAMVHYGHGDDVRDAAMRWARGHPGADWLCRHMAGADAAAMQALFERVSAQFARRFGGPPRVP